MLSDILKFTEDGAVRGEIGVDRRIDTVSAEIEMAAYYVDDAASKDPPNNVTLWFRVGNYTAFSLSGYRPFSVSIDGEITQLNWLNLRSREFQEYKRVGMIRYFETASITVPRKLYLEMMRGKRVRIFLGEITFGISGKKQAAMKTRAEQVLD